MKELSIQEKAKCYDEAIERAKKHCADYVVETIFPELKESEDEKTKKEIINYLECQSRDEPSRKDTHNKWIGYIEKYVLSNDDYCFLRDCARVLKTFGWQSYADRLTGLCPALGEEAKAMMSTPIIFDESEDERIRKELLTFFRESIHGGHILTNKEYDSWIAWLEKQGEQPQGKSALEAAKEEKIDNQNCVKPAKVEPIFNVGDKIQYLKGCGTIMTIEKIENGEYIFGNNMGHTTIESGNKWHLVEQKPAWSEEDEKNLREISCLIGNYRTGDDEYKLESWLKSLKNRVQPKQKWSDVDEKKRNLLINILNVNHPNGYFKVNPANTLNMEAMHTKELVDWLKSLRPQTTWKPSDRQIKALKEACDELWEPDGLDPLYTLWEQLKKLREE